MLYRSCVWKKNYTLPTRVTEISEGVLHTDKKNFVFSPILTKFGQIAVLMSTEI